MKQTNMQDAMNAAGITTPDQRRRQLRQDAIKRARTPHEALVLYREALEADPQAALTLFTASEIAKRAQQEIHGAWPCAGHRDASHRDAGGGHRVSDTQHMGAPAEKTSGTTAQGDGGHSTCDTHARAAPTPTRQNNAASAPGAGGQKNRDTQEPAAPGSADNAAPPRLTGSARREASTPKRSGENLDRTGVGREMRNCALDRLRINGRGLRHALPEEALQQAERWHIEARTVEAICTGLVPGVPVGEQISDEEANTRADRASKTTA